MLREMTAGWGEFGVVTSIFSEVGKENVCSLSSFGGFISGKRVSRLILSRVFPFLGSRI